MAYLLPVLYHNFAVKITIEKLVTDTCGKSDDDTTIQLLAYGYEFGMMSAGHGTELLNALC